MLMYMLLNEGDCIVMKGVRYISNSFNRSLKASTIPRTQASTFINDAAHVWNNAPVAIKNCKSLNSVKKQIKIYVCTLPI